MKGTHTCVLKRTYHIRYCLTWGVVLKKKLVFRITLNGWKWREETSTQPQWRAEWVLFPHWTAGEPGSSTDAYSSHYFSSKLQSRSKQSGEERRSNMCTFTDATIPVLRPEQLLTYVIIYTFQQKNVQKLCTLFKGYISARLQAWTNRIGPMETNFSFQSLNKAKHITRFNNK